MTGRPTKRFFANLTDDRLVEICLYDLGVQNDDGTPRYVSTFYFLDTEITSKAPVSDHIGRDLREREKIDLAALQDAGVVLSTITFESGDGYDATILKKMGLNPENCGLPEAK